MADLNEQADYPKYVEEYYDKSTEREVLAEWMLDNASKLIVSDFSSGKYSILDVGSPDGETSLKLLSLIWRNLEPGITVTYRVVNGQNSVLEQFKALVSSTKKREYKKISFDWRPATFSDYVDGKSGEVGNGSLNIALFMQSIYYEIDTETTLVNCYEKELENNGVIFCVVQHEENVIVRLRNELSGKNLPKPKSKCDITAKDIVAIAEKNEWNYQVYTAEYMLDVSECLNEGSAKGDILLDKLFNVKDTRQSMPPEVRELVTNYLKKECGGSNVVKDKIAIVLIHKEH